MTSNIKKWMITAIIMAVILVGTISTSSAYTNLAVTPTNLNTLNSFTNSGAWYNVGPNSYLLNWYGGGEYFEQPSPTLQTIAPAVYYSKVTATIMCDLGGSYWGECVSMVKNLAHSSLGTSSWRRGQSVMGGDISPGTAIAQFVWSAQKGRYIFNANGNYHAAIFRQYTYDSRGNKNGMIVWDQNFYENEKTEGIVAMHMISLTSAKTYYVVQV